MPACCLSQPIVWEPLRKQSAVLIFRILQSISTREGKRDELSGRELEQLNRKIVKGQKITNPLKAGLFIFLKSRKDRFFVTRNHGFRNINCISNLLHARVRNSPLQNPTIICGYLLFYNLQIERCMRFNAIHKRIPVKEIMVFLVNSYLTRHH